MFLTSWANNYILLLCLTITISKNGTLFKRTSNISTTSWSLALQQSRQTNSLLDCANLCVFTENSEGTCNAFKYESVLQDCLIAQVWLMFISNIGQIV